MVCYTSGCATGGHRSWGECVRAKNLHTCYDTPASGYDRSKQTAWDHELSAYRKAREQGIQPASTQLAATDLAVRASDEKGVAFDARNPYKGVEL